MSKRYENFAELDTSPVGGVVLRRGPKLLRLVRTCRVLIRELLSAGRCGQVGIARYAHETNDWRRDRGAQCHGLTVEVNV